MPLGSFWTGGGVVGVGAGAAGGGGGGGGGGGAGGRGGGGSGGGGRGSGGRLRGVGRRSRGGGEGMEILLEGGDLRVGQRGVGMDARVARHGHGAEPDLVDGFVEHG